jgi:hypothetical protein
MSKIIFALFSGPLHILWHEDGLEFREKLYQFWQIKAQSYKNSNLRKLIFWQILITLFA